MRPATDMLELGDPVQDSSSEAEDLCLAWLQAWTFALPQGHTTPVRQLHLLHCGGYVPSKCMVFIVRADY